MDLDELRSVQRTERQKDSLQHLRDSFYEDVAGYIADRKAERKRLARQAEDPFSDDDVGRLTDEIETAEDVVEAIYERRVGKVVKLASFAAADMNADTAGLTAEERDLFEDLVARIKQNRGTILEVLAGEGSSASDVADGSSASAEAGVGADSPATEPTSASGEPDASTTAADAQTTAPAPDDVLAEAMGAGTEGDSGSDAPESATGEAAGNRETDPSVPPDAPPDAVAADAPVVGDDVDGAADESIQERDAPEDHEAVRDGGVSAERAEGQAAAPSAEATAETPDADADTERVTLRITENVGRIFGVDQREYDLASEDVVTLPTTNAGPLLERNAAERLE